MKEKQQQRRESLHAYEDITSPPHPHGEEVNPSSRFVVSLFL